MNYLNSHELFCRIQKTKKDSLKVVGSIFKDTWATNLFFSPELHLKFRIVQLVISADELGVAPWMCEPIITDSNNCCMLGCRQSDGTLRCCSALSLLHINTDVTLKKVELTLSLSHTQTLAATVCGRFMFWLLDICWWLKLIDSKDACGSGGL